MSSKKRWPLSFAKYSAAGNDFILLDGREEEPAGDPGALAKALCRRGRSVGSDGLIVIEKPGADDPPEAAARMRLWNADGSTAEISGNGARCVARFLADDGVTADPVSFSSDVGLVTAWVDGDMCRLRLPIEAVVYPSRRLRVEGRELTGTYIDVGVPFFVCFHDDPDDLPIRFLGRAIRNHPELAPRGANVDFVRVEDEQRLYFRVYERGVEAETLSSGTGSVSAALAAAAAGKVSSPVLCVARGAELTVRFRRADETTTATPPDPVAEPETEADPQLDAGNASAAQELESSAHEVAPETGDPAPTNGPPLTAGEEGISFVDLEIEGDAMPIYRGEAVAQASRSPRRR